MGLAVRIAEKMHLDEASKKHFLLLNTLQEMDSLRAQREVQHKIKRNIESIFLSQGENSGDSVLMALESVELGPQELASLKREITDVIQRYVERKGSSLSVSQ